jgi:preprotein translocase subunit SecG
MQLILTVLHLMLAIGLIGLILIQHGRGADAGAAFGSGASSTVFGAQGSGSFLTRSTAVIATLFFLTSMALAYFAAQVGEPGGLMDNVEVPAPIVIDTNDLPSTDLPPGRAAEVGPADGEPVGNDMPAVDVPDIAPMSDSVDTPTSSGVVDDAPPAAPDVAPDMAAPDMAEMATSDSSAEPADDAAGGEGAPGEQPGTN